MNWQLLFKLSLFGLAMGIATAFFIPSSIELFFWVAIFIISAYFIAKYCTRMYFTNGFCLSLLNCVWIIAAHLVFYDAYKAGHTQETAMYEENPYKISPQIAMSIIGVVIGIFSGLVQALFAFIASKFILSNKGAPFQD